MAQAKVSVFSKLNSNFQSIYQLVNCTDCKRKIDLESKCSECDNRFCTECIFQMKRTKQCKSCGSKDSIKAGVNRNEFLNDLINLIQLFHEDTGQKLMKDNFLNVETAENLERIFTKEKGNVFNQQKLFATSTPNIDNTKKVVFNSDITMIPPSELNKQQIESTEKVNSKKRSNDKSSSVTSSKRKADSMNEKSENSSRSKKAKLSTEKVVVEDEEEEEENAKENCKEDEMELDKQQQQVDKLVVVEKQASRRNSTLQTKDKDDNQELNKKSSSTLQQTKDNRQIDENRLLEEKQLNEKRQLETIQLIKDQIQEFNNLNENKIQEMIFAGLTKIVSNCKQPITSAIELKNIGKISFTIEPFKEIELPRKELKNIEIQTDEIKKLTVDQNMQTESAKLIDQSMNTDLKEFVSVDVQCDKMELDDNKQEQEQQEQKKKTVLSAAVLVNDNVIKEVVDNVIMECDLSNREQLNGNHINNNKQSDIKLNGTINKSNFSIDLEFDDSERLTKEDELINNENDLNGKQQQLNGIIADKLDSDEIKKHVDGSILDDDSDDSILGASSPIYESENNFKL